MNRQEQLDEIMAGTEDHSESMDHEAVECKACSEDMVDEVHEDGHRICQECRDFAHQFEDETVEDILTRIEE